MEMIRTNLALTSAWQQKKEVQKGNIGELIVRKYLEDKGFIIYSPYSEGAHPFDILAVKNKQEVIIVEVKTKPRLARYDATGFDVSSLRDYSRMYQNHKTRVYIAFVDQCEMCVYGNWLDILEQERWVDGKKYPWIMQQRNGRDLRIYHLSSMNVIRVLTGYECEKLEDLTKSNYDYSKVRRYFISGK